MQVEFPVCSFTLVALPNENLRHASHQDQEQANHRGDKVGLGKEELRPVKQARKFPLGVTKGQQLPKGKRSTKESHS